MQRAAQGEIVEGDLAPLVHTARSVSAVYVPPPPRGLAEGRRQLLAEAARLQPARRQSLQLPLFAVARLRTAAVVVSLLVVIALLPAFTYAVANSTDGSPLYGLKVLGHEARVWLTNDPEAVADLQVAMAEEQLGDIATSLEQGRSIDPEVADRAGMRLSEAIQAVSHDGDSPVVESRLRLMSAIQDTYRRLKLMSEAGLDAGQEPLHNLMQQMERARQELHAGAGQSQGELERAREGAPADDQEFGSHGPSDSASGAQGTPGGGGPGTTDPGPASDSPGRQTRDGGPGRSEEAPTSAPAPGDPAATPAAQQGNSGSQAQPQPGSGRDQPVDNEGQGQRGNDINSRQP